MQEEKHRRVYADVAQKARERALVPGDAGSIPAVRANRSRITDAAIIPGVKIGGPVTVRIGGTGPNMGSWQSCLLRLLTKWGDTVTKKRALKLVMALGIQRNDAQRLLLIEHGKGLTNLDAYFNISLAHPNDDRIFAKFAFSVQAFGCSIQKIADELKELSRTICAACKKVK